MQPYKVCPKCQTPAPLNAPTCSVCGRQYRTQFVSPPNQTQVFSKPAPPPMPAHSSPGPAPWRQSGGGNGKKWMIAGAVLLAVLLVGISITVFRLRSAHEIYGCYRMIDGDERVCFTRDNKLEQTMLRTGNKSVSPFHLEGTLLITEGNDAETGHWMGKSFWSLSDDGQILTLVGRSSPLDARMYRRDK